MGKEEELEKLLAKAVKFEIGEDIYVEKRSALWAVIRNGFCLNTDDEFEYEPFPSSRTEEFFQRTRFELNDALHRASEALKTSIRVQ